MSRHELQKDQEETERYEEEPSVDASVLDEAVIPEQLPGIASSQGRREQIREWVALRKIALQQAAHLRKGKSIESKIQGAITAIVAPHSILEEQARSSRIQEQEELREAGWKEARNYIQVDGTYYRFLVGDVLRGDEQLPESFFSTYGIDRSYKALSLYAHIFGGRESGGRMYPKTNLATEEMIMDFARALYADIDFDHARVISDYDHGSGYTNYFLSIYKSVDPVEISDLTKPYIYEPNIGVVATRNALLADRAETQVFLEPIGKSKKRS